MADAGEVILAQRRADHVDDDGPRRQPYFSHSRMTVATAMPRSSASERWWPRIFRFLSSSWSGAENSRTGLPEGRFFTQTPCQLAGAWMPVPSALVKASLAAKRFAR